MRQEHPLGPVAPSHGAQDTLALMGRLWGEGRDISSLLHLFIWEFRDLVQGPHSAAQGWKGETQGFLSAPPRSP